MPNLERNALTEVSKIIVVIPKMKVERIYFQNEADYCKDAMLRFILLSVIIEGGVLSES